MSIAHQLTPHDDQVFFEPRIFVQCSNRRFCLAKFETFVYFFFEKKNNFMKHAQNFVFMAKLIDFLRQSTGHKCDRQGF